MRVLTVGLALAIVAGCAAALPDPELSLAWVELSSPAPSLLMAQRVDGKRWADGRYFEVTPGQHELLSWLSFEYNSGMLAIERESLRMTCEIRVSYAGFQAGQRYVLYARPLGYGAQVSLRGEHGQWLAKGKVTRCGTTF